jgi:hypothetical protein
MRCEIRRRIVLLRDHEYLAGLRDAEEISKLPADEIRDCQSVWRDVDALLFRIDQRC